MTEKKMTKAQLKKFLAEPNPEPYLSEEQLEIGKQPDLQHSPKTGGMNIVAPNSFQPIQFRLDKDAAFNLQMFRVKSSQVYVGEHTIYYLLNHFGADIAGIFCEPGMNHRIEKPLDKLIAFHPPSAVKLLLPQPETYRTSLIKIAKKYPFYTLSSLLDTTPNKHTAGHRLFLELIAMHPQWLSPLREHASESQNKTLERLLTPYQTVPEADVAELPNCLTQPLWMREFEYLPEIEIEPLDVEPHFQWDKVDAFQSGGWTVTSSKKTHVNETSINVCFAREIDDALMEQSKNWSLEAKALWLLKIKPDCIDRVLATQLIEEEDFSQSLWGDHLQIQCLLCLPNELIKSFLFNTPKANSFIWHNKINVFFQLFHHRSKAFLPLVTKFYPKYTKELALLLSGVGWYGFASIVALGLNSRWLSKYAQEWLISYTEQATHGLLHDAFTENDYSKASRIQQKDARKGLFFLAKNETTQARFEQQLARYNNPQLSENVRILLANNGDDKPFETPVSLKNLYFPVLPQLLLKKNGLAIPNHYHETVAQLLSLNNIETCLTALDELKNSVTEASLAQFGRELFHWYNFQGRPSKFRWAFATLGHTGDSETARLLAQLCKRFRTDKNRVGAYDALTMLSQIGNDAALMYIHSFTELKRFNDLKTRAEKALAGIAEERSLSLAQLADRTVPDLALERSGTLTLDFGPRQFIIRFNEHLQPIIVDAETGKIRKSLPKPAQKDDATLATEANQRFKDLKKQLKSIATMQVKRLEQAMCQQRTWSFDDFQRFFVEHPLMRHLTQRLAWAMYAPNEAEPTGKFIGLCRITEELSFTDENDDDLDNAALAKYTFTIAHPVLTPKKSLQAFSDMLADYALLQPFDQLGRSVYVYSPDDVTQQQYGGETLAFWVGKKVTTGAIMGLEHRGWIREVGESGMVYQFNKALGEDANGQPVQASLFIDEGWPIYDYANASEVNTIESVVVTGQFADLEPLSYSELQHDLHSMAWFEE